MKVKDVMSRNVICVHTDDSILAAARLMLQNRISGLPVIDKDNELIGIVTEGDFLRRGELGTPRRSPKWLEFILGPGRLAEEYVHTAGRKVDEIMTTDPFTVDEDDSLEKVVELMERHHIKRLPVIRRGRMVGIISRANLMHALAMLAPDARSTSSTDTEIRDDITAALAKQDWAGRVNVVVRNGVVERERQALIVVAENVPGVKGIRDHVVWVEPMSGMAFPSAEDEAKERAATA